MSSPRIGQILSRIVPLSDHDVEEILSEQRSTRIRFGDAALSLGLVKPCDVWSAWCEQLTNFNGDIDLDAIGIDAPTTRRLDAATARRFNAVPVRASAESVLIATASELSDYERRAIEQAAGLHAVFVRASETQIGRAMETYYASASPAPSTIAATAVAA